MSQEPPAPHRNPVSPRTLFAQLCKIMRLDSRPCRSINMKKAKACEKTIAADQKSWPTGPHAPECV